MIYSDIKTNTMINLSLKNFYKLLYILKNFFKKKHQKWFYDLENYNNYIKVNNIPYCISYNYILNLNKSIKSNNFIKNLSNKFKEVIVLIIPNFSGHLNHFNFKNKFYLFEYSINSKKYNRKLFAGPNFLRINLEKAKFIKIKKKKSERNNDAFLY